MARKLEGMPRNASTHAAGVLITARARWWTTCPLQTNDDVITTQFPMTTAGSAGPSEDGLSGPAHAERDHATPSRWCAPDGGTVCDSDDIPMDDAGVYKMISDGETDGVFQLESAGMRQFLHEHAARQL